MFRPRVGQFGLPYDSTCTGILISGQEARIVREDGSDADFNEPGELWLKGKCRSTPLSFSTNGARIGGNVTLGYWGDEEATKATFLKDGWLRTGDRFRVNEAGLF